MRIDVEIARHAVPPTVAVSGLVYDVETGLIEVVVFAAVVFVSFLYLISNGALTWGPPKSLQSGMPSRTSESTITRISASRPTPGEAA